MREVGWSLAGTMTQAALGVATTVLLARALGPSGFGVVAILLAVVFTISGLSDLGLSVGFVRIGSPEVQSGRDIRHLHTTFLLLRVGLAVVAAGLVVACGSWLFPPLRLPPDLPWLAPLAALCGVVMAVGTHYSASLQVLRNQRGLASVRGAASALRLAAYASLAALGALWLQTALVVTLAAVLVETGLTAWRAHSSAALWPLVVRRPPAEWLRFSSWVAVPAVTYALVGQSDTLLLAVLAGDVETGYWNAAARISGVLLLITGAAWSVALPYATAIVAREQLRRYLRMVGAGAVALALVTLLGVLASPLLVHLFYGARYEAATPVLRLLVLGTAIGSAVLLLVPVAYRFGRERIVASVGVVQFAVNLAGDLLLIPRYGAMGSALATLLMQVAGAAILAVAVARDARRGELPAAAIAEPGALTLQ
jgi:O-antigen/teichoic acid export membrane protein